MCADYRLPRPVCHLRGAEVRYACRIDVRSDCRGARSDRARIWTRAGAQPAQRLLWHTRSGEQPRADPLSHGGNSVAASHRDTRPDHAEHARGARIGGLVTAVHCSAHLRAADLRRARECRIEPRADGVILGLEAAIGLTAMLATASSLMLTIANSLERRLSAAVLAKSGRSRWPGGGGPLAACRLDRACGLPRDGPVARARINGGVGVLARRRRIFPGAGGGIWWARTTSSGAVCGIIAGFGICLGYVVMTRYFPQAATTYLGMVAAQSRNVRRWWMWRQCWPIRNGLPTYRRARQIPSRPRSAGSMSATSHPACSECCSAF